jgi:hypothetical protein
MRGDHDARAMHRGVLHHRYWVFNGLHGSLLDRQFIPILSFVSFRAVLVYWVCSAWSCTRNASRVASPPPSPIRPHGGAPALPALCSLSSAGCASGARRRWGEEFVFLLLKSKYKRHDCRWVNRHGESGRPYDLTLQRESRMRRSRWLLHRADRTATQRLCGRRQRRRRR